MGVIVVGYVPKPEGRAALSRAVEEARLRSSRLVVVNSQGGARKFDREGDADSETQLAEAKAELEAAGIEHEVRQVVRGVDPAEDLLSIADELSAEIIIIGLRRRSPLGKLILGSNAQRVLLEAPCPVLAVKAAE